MNLNPEKSRANGDSVTLEFMIGGEFGEQGRVPDRVNSMLYVSGYGSDFMSSIEYLHPLLGEQKQHIQGRVTWSETKVMIGNQAIGEEEGFDV